MIKIAMIDDVLSSMHGWYVQAIVPTLEEIDEDLYVSSFQSYSLIEEFDELKKITIDYSEPLWVYIFNYNAYENNIKLREYIHSFDLIISDICMLEVHKMAGDSLRFPDCEGGNRCNCGMKELIALAGLNGILDDLPKLKNEILKMGVLPINRLGLCSSNLVQMQRIMDNARRRNDEEMISFLETIPAYTREAVQGYHKVLAERIHQLVKREQCIRKGIKQNDLPFNLSLCLNFGGPKNSAHGFYSAVKTPEGGDYVDLKALNITRTKDDFSARNRTIEDCILRFAMMSEASQSFFSGCPFDKNQFFYFEEFKCRFLNFLSLVKENPCIYDDASFYLDKLDSSLSNLELGKWTNGEIRSGLFRLYLSGHNFSSSVEKSLPPFVFI